MSEDTPDDFKERYFTPAADKLRAELDAAQLEALNLSHGPMLVDPKAVDPATGISIRFIRQFDAVRDREQALERDARFIREWNAANRLVQQRAHDRAFFDSLRHYATAAGWQRKMTPAGLKVLKGLQISPE